MKTQPTTARFWEWINGDWVRISLRDGEEITHSTGGRHDEGWSRETVTWSRDLSDRDHITRITDTDGTDCDGRLSTHTVHMCPTHELASIQSRRGEIDGPIVHIPRWQRESDECSQRDYQAEAAGY